MTLFATNAAAIAMLDNFVDRVDAGAGAGQLRIYSGAVPADADAALGGAVLLGTLVMSDPAFGAAVDISPGARATANAITDDSSADATGTASFFRIVDSNSLTVMQGAVGTSGTELIFATVAIEQFVIISVTSLTVDHPES